MDHQPENSVQPEDLTRHTNTPSLATPKHCPPCPRCQCAFERLLRIEEVCWFVGFKSSTIYRKMKNGEFPRSVPLSKGSRHRGWLFSDVLSWLDERAADQTGEEE
jgi:prophage regulatory protein